MVIFANFRDKLRRYLALEEEELRDFLVTVMVLSLIAGFNDKSESFNALHWTMNYLLTLFFVMVASLVHVYTQRILAIRKGYKPEFYLNWYSLGIGLILSFLTFGKAWFFLVPGIFMMKEMEFHRIGNYKYGLNISDFGWISVSGCIANIMLAVVFKALMIFYPASAALLIGMKICVAMAIVNLIPLPPMDGAKMFFYSRAWYFFVTGFILMMSILLFSSINIIPAVIFSLLIGIVLMLWAYIELN